MLLFKGNFVVFVTLALVILLKKKGKSSVVGKRDHTFFKNLSHTKEKHAKQKALVLLSDFT